MDRPALMPGCLLLPYDTAAGLCRACGDPTPKNWCSNECEQIFDRNHYWHAARIATIIRDHTQCTKCGWRPDNWESWTPAGQLVIWSRAKLLNKPPGNWLEVNHIIPRLGQGYGSGCWHHQQNLETLCHRCHVKVTNRQRIDRHRRAH